MGVAAGIGMYAFLSILGVIDSIAGVIIFFIWLISLVRTEEGASWYWFYKSLWATLFGLIIGASMVASIAYTASSAAGAVATAIQAQQQQQTNKEEE